MKNQVDKQDIKAAKDELLRLTQSFCKQYLNNEYEMLSKKMIDKLSRKRQVPFLSGRREIWAGAVINAIGTINFLFDPATKPYVTASQIAEYFGTSTSTVGQKGKLIRDMFKLGYWNIEFSTKYMMDKNPFASLALVNGFLITVQQNKPPK
jgi:hypothetical protein